MSAAIRRVLCALALAACTGGVDVPEDAGIDLSVACATTCGPCASDELCIASGYVEPTCVKKCSNDSDCASGLKCRHYEFLTPLVDYSPPITGCASDTFPAPCGPPNMAGCSDSHGSFCLDAHHAGQEFTINGTCGYEVVSCPSSCEDPDGGSLGSHAICY